MKTVQKMKGEPLEVLEELLSDLRNKRIMIKKMLSRLPEGRLMIATAGKYYNYFDVSTVKGKLQRRSIGKDRALVNKLARRCYCEELLDRLEINISLVEGILVKTEAIGDKAIIKALPRHFDLLDPEEYLYGKTDASWPCPSRDPSVRPHAPALLIEGTDPAVWAAEPYCENTAYLEFKTHYSTRGVLCRSKSEAGILGIYDMKQIYYHSDERLVILNESVAPDIIGVRRDGALIYHEHCGMQSPRYSERLHHKLQLYEQAGIVPGRNLILSFDDENGNVNLELIEAQIDDIYSRA